MAHKPAAGLVEQGLTDVNDLSLKERSRAERQSPTAASRARRRRCLRLFRPNFRTLIDPTARAPQNRAGFPETRIPTCSTA